MKWSWQIGRVAGIGVFVHVTLFILLGWVGVNYFLPRHSWEDAARGLGFIVSLFAIVVLHELGHALTAKKFGIRTRDITLLPIGGVARLEKIPENPKQELLVALAGPAVNVILAVLFAGALAATGQLSALTEAPLVGGPFLAQLVWVNTVMALFNLLPAFPMDGGRVLRAWLAMRMDHVRATHIAAHVGQGMAWLFGLIGLFGQPLLVFIALFVWMGATHEASLAQLKSALGGIPVSRVMITEFRALSPGETLTQAMDHILSGCQHDFPVVADGRVVGVLTRAVLLTGLAQRGREAKVGEVMQQQFKTAEPSETAESAFARLQECECHTLPVLRNGQLVGMLTMETLGEFLMIQAALHKVRPGRRRAGVEVSDGRPA